MILLFVGAKVGRNLFSPFPIKTFFAHPKIFPYLNLICNPHFLLSDSTFDFNARKVTSSCIAIVFIIDGLSKPLETKIL